MRLRRAYIGIPSRGVIFSETIQSLPYIDTVTVVSPVSKARNRIIKQFLASDHDYLLTIDDDEVLPLGGLSRLMQLDADVAVIDAPSKKTGKSNIWHNKDGSIAATGFGCALFKRHIFQSIPEPWFDLSPRRRVERLNGDWIFPEIDGATPNPWGGEDVNFSLKLKAFGFTIVSVPDLICTHLEYEPFTTDKRAIELLTINRYNEITGAPL